MKLLESEYWRAHAELLAGGPSPERTMAVIVYTRPEPRTASTSLVVAALDTKQAFHVAVFEAGERRAALDVPVLDPGAEVPLGVPISAAVRGVPEVGRPLMITVAGVQLVSNSPPTGPKRYTPQYG
jgi:hypothetical protein